MRKNYDFTKAEKNPYYKKIKGKKFVSTKKFLLNLKILSSLKRNQKAKKKLSETIGDLEKRLKLLEAKIK